MPQGLQRRPRGSLASYKPRQGLARIDIAGAAEKHYARAKDATGLQKAIRAKLTAQAEFVFWWDTHAEKAEGNRYGRNRSVTAIKAGENGLPDRMMISRWRRKLNDPDAFEATYEAALAKYVRILELGAVVHVSQYSGIYEWYSPLDYVEAARAVMGGIDVDPASTELANVQIQATTFYTSEDDGLAQDWSGRVWMNPPYAQPLITQFCTKLAKSVQSGAVSQAVVYANNATETEWFHLLTPVATAICLPEGRLACWRPGNQPDAIPLQGQVVIYAGQNVRKFADKFTALGGSVWGEI